MPRSLRPGIRSGGQARSERCAAHDPERRHVCPWPAARCLLSTIHCLLSRSRQAGRLLTIAAQCWPAGHHHRPECPPVPESPASARQPSPGGGGGATRVRPRHPCADCRSRREWFRDISRRYWFSESLACTKSKNAIIQPSTHPLRLSLSPRPMQRQRRGRPSLD